MTLATLTASVSSLVLCLTGPIGCDQPTTPPSQATTPTEKPAAHPAASPKTPVRVECENTTPTSQLIKCSGDPDSPCPALDPEFCLVPKVLEPEYPNPVSAKPKYKVYWGTSDQWARTTPAHPTAIADWKYSGYCTLKADPGPGHSGFALVGGQAPVIIARRVRAASDGTQFAVQIDETMGVERVVLLKMANSGTLCVRINREAGCTQNDLSMKNDQADDFYMLVPLDPKLPSEVMPLKPAKDTPEAQAARKFLENMQSAACRTGLVSYTQSVLPETVTTAATADPCDKK